MGRDFGFNGCVDRAQAQADGVGQCRSDAVKLGAAFGTEYPFEIVIGFVGFEVLLALRNFEL